ncbi:MAG TPA: hypothetical protein VM123_21740 [archaeon]|nr:hypothetical protein [archaeon]
MNLENPAEKHTVRSEYAYIREMISGAFASRVERFHKLYLFSKLTRGEKNWRFLIVTRAAEDGRLELAAFSYEVGEEEGVLRKKLESRKARIPPEKLSEVIDKLVLRIDEQDCEYRVIDLSAFTDRESQFEFLRQTLEEGSNVTESGPEAHDSLQPGEGHTE